MEDSCDCLTGYTGNDCNSCDAGYVVSSTENLENTCELGEYHFLNIQYQGLPAVRMAAKFE